MSMTTVNPLEPFPEWYQGLRPHQADALERIEVAFAEDNADVVFVDAPTGSGKTLIGEMVRRMFDVPALYVCSDKALQRQFMQDFPYAAEIKGRNNYPTQYREDKTADDCTGSSCLFCDSNADCAYVKAKARAVGSNLAVLNTSYWLHEANGANPSFGGGARRELAIVDEADVLEGSLMGFVEFEVPQWIKHKLELTIPRKGVHKPALIKWLEQTSIRARRFVDQREEFMDVKSQRNMRYFAAECAKVAKELEIDVATDAQEEDQGRWFRDYDTKTLKLCPLIVGPYGNRYLWRHARKFVVMSATIISAEEMVESLGIVGNWVEITVPMTFPVENRPIVIAPVANVTYANMRDGKDMVVGKLASAIARIFEREGRQPMLVHTGSYQLNNAINEALRQPPHYYYPITYTNSGEKAQALTKFAEAGGILLAPSMERGVDLKDDLCRVQVIAKVPFPSLADKRVSGRLHLPGGQHWYNVQTVREIVQMTGRGVRSETDRCSTYIIDGSFGRVWSRSKSLFPAWWREAVDSSQSMGWLL